LTDSDTTAVLRETYNKSSFLSSDYSNSIRKIDASSVTHDLSITGNGKANLILGGEENDTIIGGKSNDTLQGGTGADVFVYANGDGNDIILDYAEEDKIKIKSGTIKSVKKSGFDVVFTVGSGKITVRNAANKTVTYLDAGGNKKTYGSAPLFVEDDTDYELTPNLSSIVQSKSADYSFLNVSSKLTKETNLIAYSGKK
jgi:Ca2+-binding RTX toxin-like protein